MTEVMAEKIYKIVFLLSSCIYYNLVS